MQEQSWQVPEWWYREKRPPSDNAYFENMCRVIFQAGLNWHVVDKKWPAIRKAFKDFDIEKVARFEDADEQRLMQDNGIIRNRGKIQAVVRNAETFQAIKRQYGSFQKYLDSMDKSNNYANVTKTLINNFKWLGPSSASLFLYTIGEEIDP
ncbi:MAG: DNA-3-methyladenine glycosylase I [Candidatus Bathyarchaeota archaeon]|nr:DNA-3-methyladenine glycosylase I [Candidatus Bathyarchaeota archaeon]